jgi:hypothetical protein
VDNTWYYVGGLVISCLFAVACYYVAKSKGRGTILWPILGFFFSWIALLIVAIMPRKKA